MPSKGSFREQEKSFWVLSLRTSFLEANQISSGDWNQSQFSGKFHAEITSAKSRILWLSDGESPSENRKLEMSVPFSDLVCFLKNLKEAEPEG